MMCESSFFGRKILSAAVYSGLVAHAHGYGHGYAYDENFYKNVILCYFIYLREVRPPPPPPKLVVGSFQQHISLALEQNQAYTSPNLCLLMVFNAAGQRFGILDPSFLREITQRRICGARVFLLNNSTGKACFLSREYTRLRGQIVSPPRRN